MTAEAVIKSSPRWQGLTVTGKQIDADNTPEPGRPIIINCHGHTEVGICRDCAEAFMGVLHDVPQLLDDLDIAISGWARFVERGARPDTDAVTAGLNPAIQAQQRLEAALAGAADWFDAKAPWFIAAALATHLHQLHTEPRMPQLARDISQAASRAHKVIDMPVVLFPYGPCPECGEFIRQERIHPDDTETEVKCRLSCGYAATVDVHQRKIIEASLDRYLTVAEMVGVFEFGGVPVTRDQIYHWIKKGRIIKGPSLRPEWRDGEVVMVNNDVATYRVRDVLPLAQDAAERADKKRSTKKDRVA